jgi:hypothetical protein
VSIHDATLIETQQVAIFSASLRPIGNSDDCVPSIVSALISTLRIHHNNERTRHLVEWRFPGHPGGTADCAFENIERPFAAPTLIKRIVAEPPCRHGERYALRIARRLSPSAVA